MAAGSTNFPTSLDSNTVATGATEITSTGYNNHSVEVEALQAKVGVNSSAVTTSHDYKLSGVTGSDKAVSKTGTETLTNKTLTSPTITGAVITPELLIAGTGTTWVQASYVPTFTNFTKGSATILANYIQIGKRVFAKVDIKLAADSSMGTGILVSLPVTAATNTFHAPIGQAILLDSGTNNYAAAVWVNSTTTAGITYHNVTGSLISFASITSTAPYTWTTNDALYITMNYEAA